MQTYRSSHGDDAWQGVQGTCQACSSDETEDGYIRVVLEGCQVNFFFFFNIFAADFPSHQECLEQYSCDRAVSRRRSVVRFKKKSQFWDSCIAIQKNDECGLVHRVRSKIVRQYEYNTNIVHACRTPPDIENPDTFPYPGSPGCFMLLMR